MSPKIDNYTLGMGGVNLVKNPLELEVNELTQSQNAELIPDQARGGEGSLSKRGGLAALGSALSGSVSGIISLPLQTTFTRVLYASLGTADSDTWLKTTNGTAWTSLTSPVAASSIAYETVGTAAFAAAYRASGYRNYIIYPGNAYTADFAVPTNNTSLPLIVFDGTNTNTLLSIPIGADGNFPFKISDMLVANGTLYIATHDSPNSGSPNQPGRVMAVNLDSGTVTQVANKFGAGTNEVSGGTPVTLEWYQGRIWAGLDGGNGTASVGKVVWAYPGVDQTWTSDVTNLQGYPHSLCQYRGELYCGLRGNATFDAAVFKRTSSTGAWTSSDTTVTSGIDFYASLIVYLDELYAVVYSDGGTDITHIKKFDGTTWTTDRDVDLLDSAGVAMNPVQPVLYGADLYYPFQSSGVAVSDGFILRKSAGTWTKVVTDNINGRMVILLQRT